MADLFWNLLPVVFLIWLILALLRGYHRAIYGAVTGLAVRRRPKLPLGVVVWAAVRGVVTVIRAAVGGAGRGLASAGRASAAGARTTTNAEPGTGRWPSPFARQFWWKTADELDFEAWEQEHRFAPGEDE